MRLKMLCAPLAMMVTGAAALAAPGTPATWEVSGVKLGMNDEQAEAALKARGFTVVNTSRGWGFKQQVQSALGQNPGNVSAAVTDIEATKGNERVRLKFINVASGTTVSQVYYTIPTGQLSGEEAVAAMIKRVGPPAAKRLSKDSATWCTDDPRRPAWCDGVHPSLSVSAMGGVPTAIILEAGRELWARHDAEVAAAAKASPARVKPSF